MSGNRVTEILQEFQPSGKYGADPQLRALEAAIFLEESFGITLADDQIDHALLGSIEGMAAVLDACRND